MATQRPGQPSVISRLRHRWTAAGQHTFHDLRRDWAAARAASDNPLLRCGEKHFSQFDEDGILLETLRRLELASGRFIEIGVGDGTENNTLVLMAHGWRGQWIGGEPLAWQPSGKRLTFTQAFVTAESVCGLVSGDCDVLSLDIDGNDYWVARALLGRMAPRVLIVEYNARCPPPVRFVMPYDPEHRWDGSDYFGASLAAWSELLGGFGYRAVCCSYQGTNAFFVRTSDSARFADVPVALDRLYRPAVHVAPFDTGHRVSPRTLAVLEQQ